jgi:hypothetical protein
MRALRRYTLVVNTPAMRTRTHFLPIENANMGMVLAEAVKDAFQRTLLPTGSVLTEENLQQLQSHLVEFIRVSVADERTDDEMAAETATATRSVMEIFADADLSQPTMAALLNQVLLYRSA